MMSLQHDAVTHFTSRIDNVVSNIRSDVADSRSANHVCQGAEGMVAKSGGTR